MSRTFLLSSLFIVGVFFLSLFWGVDLDHEKSQFIIQELRLPRVLMAFLCGGGLALSGLVFQSLFQNNLASPYTLGISSGSSFVVVLILFLNLHFEIFGLDGEIVGAFLGAILSTWIISFCAKVIKSFSPYTLLLAGVAQSMFFISGVFLIQFLSLSTSLSQMMRWSFGSLNVVGFESPLRVFVVIVFVVFFLLRKSNELSLLQLGDEFSKAQGLNVDAFRKRVFWVTSLLIGGIISEVGPIGFVGLLTPHFARIMIDTNKFKYLLPYSFLLGGGILVSCDFLSRALVSEVDLPIGVITSFIGGPFFFYLLIKKNQNH